MGLFDSLFGSKQTTKQKTTLDEATTGVRDVSSVESQKTQQTQTGETTSTQDTTQQQTVTTLDAETQSILQNLISSLSGSFAESGGTILSPEVSQAVPENLDFARFLSDRATETESVIGSNTDAIITEARRQGENALEIQGTQLAAGAGSNLNSIVQAANAQGRSDLETSLAGLAAQLGISARQAGSQDLATAFGARNEAARGGADIQIAGQTAGSQQITQLVQALAGATQETTGVTSAVGATTEQQTLEQLVAAIQEISETSTQTRTATQTGNVEQRGRDSLAGIISSFF